MGRKKTILLVDDETDYLEIAAAFLGANGFHVATAPDGSKAIQYLSEAAPPALVVLDLKMPKADGWAVFVWLKAQSRLKNVPVIIASGVHLSAEMAEQINRHAPFWLQKPVDPEDLLAAITKHI